MIVNNVLDLSSQVSSFELFTYDRGFVERVGRDYFRDIDYSLTVVEFDHHLEAAAQDGARLTPLEILQGITNYRDVEGAIAGLEVLVVNGGGYFNELWCQPHRVIKMLKMIAPILIAEDLGIRVVFTGNSYGPFGPRSAFLINILASLRNAVFYARDRVGSIAELHAIGVPESRVRFVPDDLFILNDRLNLRRRELELPDSYVAFETYQPIDVLASRRHVLERFDAQMSGRGLEVVTVPMYAGRGGQDQAEWLAREFGWRMSSLDSGYLTLEDAREVISRARILLSERYHGLVLALANSTPAVHALRSVMDDKWYYYRKSLGIIDTALRGVPYSQREFMATDPFQALDRVGTDLEEIQRVQGEWFNKGLQANIEVARETRRRMLEDIIGREHPRD
ncbi:polysaccharide pyruvyl transferase family protein [Citricoccus sp.]|uniref:polysaccharide pyruvyl transferase family protein n=1 Tax=Citricoccus sp. TaxID=1978372 RepID=UPI00261E4C63|nr:polysaccharide pyruvyl transferase family protein [Citricoccus sp.]HRO31310.1 polysaccharide pyruvyl transferase family protein [Citricoccus sp.]